MCSEPVTFGGGMTMVNGSASVRRAGAGAEGVRLLPDLGDLRLDVLAS